MITVLFIRTDRLSCINIRIIIIIIINRWTYQTEKELDGRSHWGRITTYSGGGFTMLLEAREEKTKELIAKLKVSCKKMLCMLVDVQ